MPVVQPPEDDTESVALKKMVRDAATEVPTNSEPVLSWGMQCLPTMCGQAFKLLRLPNGKGLASTLSDPERVIDTICAHLDATVAEKQVCCHVLIRHRESQ